MDAALDGCRRPPALTPGALSSCCRDIALVLLLTDFNGDKSSSGQPSLWASLMCRQDLAEGPGFGEEPVGRAFPFDGAHLSDLVKAIHAGLSAGRVPPTPEKELVVTRSL